jgi:NitT/TauT family transport system ATP-binding protein
MILRLERVSKSFSAQNSHRASHKVLSDFSLELEEKEFVSVIGPSGCGKSTLLRLVAGFEQSDSGRIIFDGDEVTGPSSDRVLVFQQAGLYPWLDVRRNIAFGLRFAHRKIDWSRVDHMIEIVGLGGFERHASYELSGGMQQRVALARALIMDPKMLLMDEPFAALDSYLRRSMQDFLIELWETMRTTILFITHDVEEAILLSDRVAIMSSTPGPMLDQLHVDLPRPRAQIVMDDPRFRQMRATAVGFLSDSPDNNAASHEERGQAAGSSLTRSSATSSRLHASKGPS